MTPTEREKKINRVALDMLYHASRAELEVGDNAAATCKPDDDTGLFVLAVKRGTVEEARQLCAKVMELVEAP